MFRANFINYFDVWNGPDGYEVNNLCVQFERIPLADLEDKTLIDELKARNFLNDKANPDTVTVNDYYPYLELEVTETGEPIGRYEIIEE